MKVMKATRTLATVRLEFEVAGTVPVVWQFADEEHQQKLVPCAVQISLNWREDGWRLSYVSVTGRKVKKDGKPGQVKISNDFGQEQANRYEKPGCRPSWLPELIKLTKLTPAPVPAAFGASS